MTQYQLDFKYNSEGADLDIYNGDGDLIACFVGGRAIKAFLLLMAFPTEVARTNYLSAHLGDLINADF